MDPVTNGAAVAAATGMKEAVREYVTQHVMYRVIHTSQWNIPFTHVRFLEPFSRDEGMLVLAAVLLIGVFLMFRWRKDGPPRGMANLLEAAVQFIRDEIAIPFLGERNGRRMTPLFCSFFFFIATVNLLGLIPCFCTATGNVNVTGGLALITLGFWIPGGMVKKGVAGFFRSLVPGGVPWVLGIVLAPIELVSLFTKAFALTIRLFANMVAGHMTLFCLMGVLVLVGFWGLPLMAVGAGIYLFEVFVAVFQAYIFTLLSALFMGQVYQEAH
jgi:F-type H+-transporting ATPase subunit a